MEFNRSGSGIENRDLFVYPKILVYVEGHTDFPFYEEVLQNYNCHLKAQGGKQECMKLVSTLIDKDPPYVVILDGDYDILERIRSIHKRVILLHRYSYENYLIEEGPIDQFCRDRFHSKDSLVGPLASGEFTSFIEQIEEKFKDLLILDVAHQRSKTGKKSFFNSPDRFYKDDFRVDQIRKQHTVATNNATLESVEEAKTLIVKFLEKRRLVDLLPGRFVFGIIRRFVSNTVGKSIPSDEIRPYLSRIVWQFVKTRDHNSLKRRLRNAVLDAKRNV